MQVPHAAHLTPHRRKLTTTNRAPAQDLPILNAIARRQTQSRVAGRDRRPRAYFSAATTMRLTAPGARLMSATAMASTTATPP